jgi:predicted LPLAT superfamily acyltransferase
MARISMRIGRPAGRVLLYAIAAYFFVFAPRARRSMRDYLRHALGREPGARDRFRHLMTFATCIHDRMYLLAERYQLFDVSLQGEQLMADLVAAGGGVLLMGAHVGSFEVLRWLGRHRTGLGLAMAMYEDNARKVREALAAVAPRMGEHIVPLGRLDSMLRLEARLAEGSLVGILADRTLGDEPCLEIAFLGGTARFPTGPMRIAAALRQRVLFMAGVYRGANRYEIHFEPIADFAQAPDEDRTQRARRIEEAIARYAACLERHCRAAPDNFFNFYRFWL